MNKIFSLNLREIKKGDVITIEYITIHLRQLKKKLMTGVCVKIKRKERNSTITIKTKIKKDIIQKTFLVHSPIILRIIKNK